MAPFLARFVLCTVLVLLGATPRPAHDLVDVQALIPNARFEIRYATTNNFTGKKVYDSAQCFLRRATAEKLAAVQRELAAEGLRLKIFDGYRPLAVQKKFWALVPDERYVANPAKGSRHNRGAAVDLTLIKTDGTELPMGTDYDDFSEKAHRDYQNLPAEALANRQRLERVMIRHGFVGLPTEWWHFDDSDWQKYELLDVNLKKLSQSLKRKTSAKN